MDLKAEFPTEMKPRVYYKITKWYEKKVLNEKQILGWLNL